jgi:hypothetical protein
MMTRRRLSRMGRMTARVAYDAGGIGDAIITYCSRYGDSRLTLSLLKDIVADDLPSPVGFGMAVHNSFAGVLSILGNNKLGHTAVAADQESLGAGLLESAMTLAERPENRVLLICGHEPLASIYEPYRRPDDHSLAVALLLEPLGEKNGNPSLIGNVDVRPPGDRLELEALAFVRFLLATDHGATFFSAGITWSMTA